MSLYFVGSEGPKDAEIAFVAEKPAVDEVIKKRPLIGTTGGYLRDHANSCGLKCGFKWYDETKREWQYELSENVYLTNSVQHFDEPSANPTFDQLWSEQPRLIRELAAMPNLKVIVPLGNWALASLGNMAYSGVGKDKQKKPVPTGIMNYRGSVIPSIIPSRIPGVDWVKMIPTLHPSFYVHDNWAFKSIVQFDIHRAVEQLKFPERRYQERFFNIRPAGVVEALRWFDEIERALDSGLSISYRLKNGDEIKGLAFDIEAIRGRYDSRYICCFSLAVSPWEGYCIPITYNNRMPYFSIDEEAQIWRRLQKLLQRDDITLFTQNGLAFDAYISRQHGICIPPYVSSKGWDTMHSHSLLAADLPHDLGFLTSVYTDYPYYKNESGDWKNLIKTPEDQFWQYSCTDAMIDLEVGYGEMSDMLEAA